MGLLIQTRSPDRLQHPRMRQPYEPEFMIIMMHVLECSDVEYKVNIIDNRRHR